MKQICFEDRANIYIENCMPRETHTKYDDCSDWKSVYLFVLKALLCIKAFFVKARVISIHWKAMECVYAFVLICQHAYYFIIESTMDAL